MDFLLVILQALWFIWPAYCANAFPTVIKGKRPLDGGKLFHKNRLLGDGKTVEGTFSGIIFGILVGILQMYIYRFLPSSLQLYSFSLFIIILMCIGTMIGDVLGSFIKRRKNMKPGDSAFLLDKLGFLVFAILFSSIVYIPPINTIIILLIITPAIHLGTNILAYLLKLKKHPW